MVKDRAHQFRVIHGNMDCGISIVTEMLLKRYVPEELQLVVQTSSYAEELIELAEKARPDLFIFYFNNIMFATADSTFPNSMLRLPRAVLAQQHGRFLSVLQMISHARNTFNAPILVFSGHDGDPPLTEFIKEVADIYSHAPIEFEEIGPKLQRLFGWEEKT